MSYLHIRVLIVSLPQLIKMGDREGLVILSSLFYSIVYSGISLHRSFSFLYDYAITNFRYLNKLQNLWMKGFHIIQISLCDSSLVLSIVRKTCNNIWNLFKNKLGLKKKIYDRVNQIYIITSLLYPRLFCGERDLTTYPLILFFYFVLRISEIVIIWEMTSFHLLNTSRH